MSLPATFALSAVLLLGAAVHAQPAPVREHRQRSVTVTGDSTAPPQEVRVAKGVATVLLFGSPIDAAAIEVDTKRVRLLAAGEGSVVFEPLVEPGSGEDLLLRVPFAEGERPARAVFVLVSSATEVDTRIEVARRKPTAEVPARCASLTPTRFLRDGWLTITGVVARQTEACASAARGLECEWATIYQAKAWVLVDVALSNAPGHPPWVPSEVTLRGVKSGVLLKVNSVELQPAKLQPGGKGRLFVEAAPPTSEEAFNLEVRDAAGRGFRIPNLNLSIEESKP